MSCPACRLQRARTIAVAALALPLAAGPGSAGEPPIEARWIGGVGLWSEGANWDVGVAPNNDAGADTFVVLVDDGDATASESQVNGSPTVSGLVISPGDAIVVTPSRTLSIETPDLPTFSNEGSLVVDGSLFAGGTLRVATPSLLLSGGGVLELRGPADGVENLAAVTGLLGTESLVNQDHLVRGAGRLGDGTLHLVNLGTIQADVIFEPLVVEANAGGCQNFGTMTATGGGRLDLRGLVASSFGCIVAEAQSVVLLGNATIDGGTLETVGDGLLLSFFGPTTWESLTHDGRYELGPTTLELRGTVVNQGMMTILSGNTAVAGGGGGTAGSIVVDPSASATLGGSGTLCLLDGGIRSKTAATALLVVGPGQTIEGKGNLGGETLSLSNFGTIEATSDDTRLTFDTPPDRTMVNETDGVIRASGLEGLLYSTGSVRNDGTVEVTNGSIATFAGTATLENRQSNRLVGGTWRVLATDQPTALFLIGTSFVVNEADVLLSGADSLFPQIDNFTFNFGSFAVAGGRDFDTASTFVTDGVLSVGAASRFDVDGDLLVQPGNVLRYEIADPLDGGPGQTLVFGSALLDGALELEFVPGYEPEGGTMITLLNAAEGIEGSFTTVTSTLPVTVLPTADGTLTVCVVADEACPGDLDRSGAVGVADLLGLLGSWGPCPRGACPGDLDGDGMIDVSDLLDVLGMWGRCP